MKLDSIQQKILDQSPSDGSTVVAGPPGSGKSLVAINRAKKLADEGKHVTLVVFNTVLARFCAQTGNLPFNVSVSTMNAWFNRWYTDAFGTAPPLVSPYVFDWGRIITRLHETPDEELKGTSWGHLIIDEGQDFPPQMYEFFYELLERYRKFGTLTSLMVLADDNQSVFDDHSSLIDIRTELNVRTADLRFWRLDSNYRNSEEIYGLARYFQLSGTTATKSPTRQSKIKPQVKFYEDKDVFASRYILYISAALKIPMTQDAPKIGVISLGDSNDVIGWYNRLVKFQEANESLSETLVQCYSRKKEYGHNNAKLLDFVSRPSITVLHAQSSKGLEFDVVVMVDIENFRGNINDGLTQINKIMYVQLSRAKHFVFIGVDLSRQSISSNLGVLPQYEQSDLLQYDTNLPDLEQQLQSLDWQESGGPDSETIKIAFELADRILQMSASELKVLLDSKVFGARKDAQKLVFEERIKGSKADLVDLILEIEVKKFIKFFNEQANQN